MAPLYLILGLTTIFLMVIWYLVFMQKPFSLFLLILVLLSFDNISIETMDIKIRFAELIGLGTFFLVVLKSIIKKKKMPSPPGYRTILTFIGVSFLIVFLKSSSYFKRGIVLETHILVLFLVACTLYWIYCQNERYDKLEDIVFLMVEVIIIFGIIQFLAYYLLHYDFRWVERIELPGNLAVNIHIAANNPESAFTNIGDSPWYRASSLLREAGFLGLAGVWLYAVSIGQLLSPFSSNERKRKSLYRCLLSMITLAITFSRASIFAFFPSTLMALLFSQKYRSQNKSVIFLIFLPTAFLFILSDVSFLQDIEIINLVLTRVSGDFVSDDLRWAMYAAQLENFLQHPLLGIGPGATEDVIRLATPDHWEPDTIAVGGYSSIFTILNDTGGVGLALFIAAFVAIYAAARRNKSLIHCGVEPKSFFFFNGLLAIVFWGAFAPFVFGFGFFWFGLALTWTSIERDKAVLQSCSNILVTHFMSHEYYADKSLTNS